ncbi:MAG TPA: molybdopterin molybdotransferase MoeA [Steroidobacteraceae bacterium]
MTPQAAQETIDARMTPLAVESRPLEQCIGAILRQDVYAERDNPPFDRVCMDGIAIHSSVLERGVRRFEIEATQPAGAPAITLSKAENAIEVMTGAMLPRGTDCIIPLEEYDLAGNVVSLKDRASGSPFRNVQRRGSDSEPGVPMLTAGTRLGAPEIAVVASAGLATVHVSREPRFMVISTGNELVDPGQPIEEHQVRRSNAYAVVAALRRRGFERVGNDHIPDDEDILHERLTRHLLTSDVLILSGGVSKGKFDLVPQALKRLGVAEVFYQVAQRPGMPMWFGMAPGGQAVFGLPGNPVSTLICLIRYVVPAMAIAMGAARILPQPLPLSTPVKFHRNVAYFLPVSVRYDDRGHAAAVPRPPNGPGDFLALTKADGFVELPPRAEGFAEGFVASFYRW